MSNRKTREQYIEQFEIVKDALLEPSIQTKCKELGLNQVTKELEDYLSTAVSVSMVRKIVEALDLRKIYYTRHQYKMYQERNKVEPKVKYTQFTKEQLQKIADDAFHKAMVSAYEYVRPQYSDLQRTWHDRVMKDLPGVFAAVLEGKLT